MQKKEQDLVEALPSPVIRSGVSFRHTTFEQLKRSQSVKTGPLTEGETLRLLYELETYQIELEMQNEELKRSFEKAVTATKKFTELYDLAPTGHITLDIKGNICALNDSGATMLGMERPDLINKNFKLFVTNHTLSIFNDFLDKVFASGLKQSCEVTLIVNENTLHVRFEGIVSENEQQCLITIADISNHIMADEKLLSSETRYRRLFESAKVGILILDAISGEIVDVNPYLFKMLGYSKEELLGKELWEIGMFKNIADSKDAFIELQDKGYIRFDDMPLKTKNGKSINVEFVSNVYLADLVKVIQCNIRDITERKLAEAAFIRIVEELRRLATVVSDSNDAVIMHDFDGKIMAWNRGAIETYGYTEAEALEMNVRDIVAGPDRDAALSLIRKIKDGAIVKSFELRRVTKDGRILDVWLTTTLLTDEKGTPVAIATTERDITERKRAEMELITSKEKAEESDRLKTSFLANMSHELRTPLNSIIGFSELMIEPDYDVAQQHKFAQMINVSGSNLLAIINDIMAISKIEAGQVQIKKRLFSASRLISNIQKEFSFKAIEKGIELQLDLTSTNEVFIESDESKIRNVLVNLIGNAIKFTKVGLIGIGFKTIADFVQFHVRDTGIGISKEYHEQIFVRFLQVESALSRKYGGNGLGLPISKSLVELLGGSIWMESEQGKGSTFYFTIPIKKAVQTK